MDLTGKLLGNRYEILEKIGDGGMAHVYKARCTLLKRFVAVKVLKDEFRVDEEFVSRFNIESQAAASLSHPNIVSIYDVGFDAGVHYIVLEYVEGITLKEYIERNGMLPWREALLFCVKICMAMDHAHKKKIIHRDIKPHNIMLTNDGTLKITDFGIARTINKDGKTVDNKNAIGTVHYISPEQARGGYVDEKSDIYSIGVVLYEMLTGRMPFDNDNAVSIAIMHMQEEPVHPRELNITIPLALEEICLRAMAKEQSRRFAAVSDMLSALSAIDISEEILDSDINRFSTKIVDVEKINEKVRDEKVDMGRKRVKKSKKEDKVAIIAAVIVSVIIVMAFSAVLINLLDPGFFPSIFSPGSVEPPKIDKVPDLVGKKFDDIKKEYEKSKVIKIVEDKREPSSEYAEGVIIKQDPKAGEPVKSTGSTQIKLTVSSGSGGAMDVMPDFAKKELKKVEEILTEAKVKYSVVEQYDEDVLEGFVISHSPTVGKSITSATEVILYVSKGVDKDKTRATVPFIVGMSESEAKRAVEGAGLVWGQVARVDSDRPEGTVVSQYPSASTEVNRKTEVNVNVSNGIITAASPSPDVATPTPPPAQKTKYMTFYLPQDRDSVNLKVWVNGELVHNSNYSTGTGYVELTLKGSGKCEVKVYHDDIFVGSSLEDFDRN